MEKQPNMANAKFNLLEATNIKVTKGVQFEDVNLTNLLLIRIMSRLENLEKISGTSLQLQLNDLDDHILEWVLKNFVQPVAPTAP
jgi:hypothetical protein